MSAALTEEQKARIVELARRCEHARKVLRGWINIDLKASMLVSAAQASAEAFRIAGGAA